MINGTDFVSNPWITTFSPFTDLLGNGFFLIPVSFIGLALYIKTRNPVLVSAYLIAAGLLLSSGSMFVDYPEMAIVYTVFTVLSLIGLVLSLYFMRK